MRRKRKHGTPKAGRTPSANDHPAVTLDSLLTDPDALKTQFKRIRRSTGSTANLLTDPESGENQ